MAGSKGLFITFEGGDGSGKTTQASLLLYRLRSSGIPAVKTYEPGGTPLGLALRELLLNSFVAIEPVAELLLFTAARLQNVDTVIRPAIKAGAVVICDRFIDSTTAYQGYGKGLDLELIASLNNSVAHDLTPDLTVLLDIDPEAGLNRVAQDEADGDRIGGHLQLAFDMGDPLSGKRHAGWELEVHKKIREGYLAIASSNPARWVVLDATMSQQRLSDNIWERVKGLLPSAAPSENEDLTLSREESPGDFKPTQ